MYGLKPSPTKPSNEDTHESPPIISVVIPSYRVTSHILEVIKRIPDSVSHILVIDDACPDQSGRFVEDNCQDPRVTVLRHEQNQGVGGAVLTGFKLAQQFKSDVIIKIDGDGQMDPALADTFAEPILSGEADYVKGNRFFYLDAAESMPVTRRIGNLGLTFISRFSTGYYSTSDPTNGYVAISGPLANNLPIEKLSKRYFFETDLLFRINTLGGVVVEIPHDAFYGEETSHLNASKEFFNFFKKNVSTYFKRLFYQYILRDFNLGSLLLFGGVTLGTAGLLGGIFAAFESWTTGQPRSGGALAILEVQIILSAIFLVGFLNFDVSREPNKPITPRLTRRHAKPLVQYDDEN
jgi:dolichol-phosphate mannosyltransferase